MNKAQGRRQQKQAKKPAKNQKRGRPAAASDLQALLQEGLRAHQAGQLADAEATYRRVLGLNPDHADANHLLGVIAHQVGDHGAAVELIGKAIRQRPPISSPSCKRAWRFWPETPFSDLFIGHHACQVRFPLADIFGVAENGINFGSFRPIRRAPCRPVL